jgi:hypothetical protein
MLTVLVACSESEENESVADSSAMDEAVSYSEYQNEKGEYIAKTSGNGMTVRL